MDPAGLPVCNAAGEKLSGEGKITSEIFTHLTAFEERPDIVACVHAHPPSAIALMLAGLGMEAYVVPEVVYSVGVIPTAPYATPGTPEGANAERALVRRCSAFLLERHGALTPDISLMEAYLRMEKLEHSVEIIFKARLLGAVKELSPLELKALQALRAANNPPRQGLLPARVVIVSHRSVHCGV